MVDCEEYEKALYKGSQGVKTWSINVESGNEAKSVNDILPWKAIAVNEIRKRSPNSRKYIIFLRRRRELSVSND